MPLYEYYCEGCNQVVELLVRTVSEKPVCPKCNSRKLEKQLSVAAAPAAAGKDLPVYGSNEAPTCGRPQCASRCMFE